MDTNKMNGLLFITHHTGEYGYIRSAEMALEGGCRMVQLRMKDSPPEEVEETARHILKRCKEHDALLFIDDHVEVCRKVKASGVHLGKLDMDPAEARKILKDNYLIGGTANTFGDIQRLADAKVNYIGLGPFRFTTTKKNLSPILGLDGYHQIMKQCKDQEINIPVLAIGGIETADIREILDTGVSGIALSSTILKAGNPVERTRDIIQLINQYQS